LFRIGIGLKGLDGILEITGGLLLEILGTRAVSTAVTFLTQHELSEDPHDFLANIFVRFSDHLQVGTVHFAAMYLLVHGLVKIGLAAALLKERLWAFPMGMGFLGLFILYQLYRFNFTHGIGLGLLTILDAGVLLLVWREYLALRSSVREESQ